MKGLFIPGIDAEMFRNGCLESIEALMAEGEIYDIDYPLEQKPKTGHWILTDVERNRIWGCKCSECGKDPQDYIYGSEDWWLTYGNLPKFCPTCGSINF